MTDLFPSTEEEKYGWKCVKTGAINQHSVADTPKALFESVALKPPPADPLAEYQGFLVVPVTVKTEIVMEKKKQVTKKVVTER